MKKLLFILLSLTIFATGCSKKENSTIKEEKKLGCSIETTCDEETEIKKYENAISSDTFIPISMEESIKSIENKETLVLFFGFKTCPWCQDMIEYLKEEADNSNVKVYYVNVRVDGDTSEFDLRKEDNPNYVKLQELLKDTFMDDTKKIYVPLVISIKNGKILDYNYSTVEGHDAKEREMNSEEITKLKNIYKTMFEEFKK